MPHKFYTLAVFLWIAGMILAVSIDSPWPAIAGFGLLLVGRFKMWRDTRRSSDV